MDVTEMSYPRLGVVVFGLVIVILGVGGLENLPAELDRGINSYLLGTGVVVALLPFINWRKVDNWLHRQTRPTPALRIKIRRPQ